MSRSGRSQDVLTDWRDHPRGCKEEHGFHDGYDGICTDDPWEVMQVLDDIDPFFRQDEIQRLRKLLEWVAPAALAAYDARLRPDDKPDLLIWEGSAPLFPRDLWEKALNDRDREDRIKHAHDGLLREAHKVGATITHFSDPEPTVDPAPYASPTTPLMVIRATGWICPEAVATS